MDVEEHIELRWGGTILAVRFSINTPAGVQRAIEILRLYQPAVREAHERRQAEAEAAKAEALRIAGQTEEDGRR